MSHDRCVLGNSHYAGAVNDGPTQQKSYRYNKFRSGIDRRGVFPEPRETARDRVERIIGRPIEEIVASSPKPSDTVYEYGDSAFAEHDLGNPELPIFAYKQEILSMIDKNKISQLNGETGSGKTTQLCQFALQAGYDRVVYLMPRRNIVDNTSDRVDYELREQLGDEMPDHLVGKAHGEAVTITEESKIQFMTAATLSNKLPELRREWGNDRVLFISDEIHENILEMEVATALVAKAVDESKTESWRLVLSTATPDKVTAKTYRHINESGEVPAVRVPTRPHKLEMIEDFIPLDDAYEKYGMNIKKTMVFVEGVPAAREAISEMKKKIPRGDRVRFLILHSKMSDAVRDEIYKHDPAEGERWVIVSTAAGQSGITIPGVELVISNGLTRNKELDIEGQDGLPIRLCSQAALFQQGGRAGRDISGGLFVLAGPIHANQLRHRDDPLYQKVPLKEREETLPPEIYHTNLAKTVLVVEDDGCDFDELNDERRPYLPHRVSKRSSSEAYEALETLEAIAFDDNDKSYVTTIGHEMNGLPLRPELARSAYEALHGGYPLNVQTAFFAIAAAVEAGGFADKTKTTWKNSLDSETDDDYLAEYDMFLRSRPYFYGRTVDEKATTDLGYEPTSVRKAHRLFNKICRRRGLNPYDVDYAPLTPDEKEQVKDILLVGMQDLMYEHCRTVKQRDGKGVPTYKNMKIMADKDRVVERELSNRGILRQKLGKRACKIVAGEGWWYIDAKGNTHSLIERGMPVSHEQIGRVMARVAIKEPAGLAVKHGVLMDTYQQRWGSMVKPLSETKGRSATTKKEVDFLLNNAVYGVSRAELPEAIVGLLDDSAIENGEKRALLRKAAQNATSVYDINNKLWGIMEEFRNQQTAMTSA